ILKEMERVGGYSNAYTGYDKTVFMANVPKDNLTIGMDLVVDLMFDAIMPEEHFETEKGIVINEIAMRETNTADVCIEHLLELIYSSPDTDNIMHPIIG